MKKSDLVELCHVEVNLLIKFNDNKIKAAMCLARYQVYKSLLLVYFDFDIEKYFGYRELIQGVEKDIYEK